MSLLKKKYMRCVKGIYIFFLLLFFIFCELEDKIGRYILGDNLVEVEFMICNVILGGSEFGVILKCLCVIVVVKNSGKVEMNCCVDLSDFLLFGLEYIGGVFKFYFCLGDYDLFVIGNEMMGMNFVLIGELFLLEIKSVLVILFVDMVEFVVCKYLDIWIRNVVFLILVIGEVSVDEGLIWNLVFLVELECIVLKVSLEI